MKRKQIQAGLLIVFSMVLSSFGYYFYQIYNTPNLRVDKEEVSLYIPPGATFKDVQGIMAQGYVEDLMTFSFLAKVKKYHKNVKPGHYVVKPNMTNNQAVNMLRSGSQTPVRITFNTIRLLDELPGKITKNIALDSITFNRLLADPETPRKYGFDAAGFVGMFIPNTYEVYWTISAEQLLDRMHSEYQKYWTEARRQQAADLGLTPQKVATLASIVEAEVAHYDEAKKVAGVYINRLKRNMLLQADPTVKFAVGDFSLKRVLTVHTEVDSPYNTYKYAGLPPGPINMPSITAIEAVLNYEQHKYLYFCAKEDFSGYHAFAKTLTEHNRNSARYQAALNKRRIYR